MKVLEKIKSAYKAYKYKLFTAVVALILCSILYRHFPSTALSFVITGLGLFITGYFIYGFYRGVLNTWREGSKILAIVYGVFGVAFVSLITYLIITKS